METPPAAGCLLIGPVEAAVAGPLSESSWIVLKSWVLLCRNLSQSRAIPSGGANVCCWMWKLWNKKLSFPFSWLNDAGLGFASQSCLQKNLLLGFPPISDRSMVRHPEATVLLKIFMLKCPCVHSDLRTVTSHLTQEQPWWSGGDTHVALGRLFNFLDFSFLRDGGRGGG